MNSHTVRHVRAAFMLAASTLALLAPRSAHAQSTTEQLPAQKAPAAPARDAAYTARVLADSLAVAGDTARAIAILDSLVRRHPRNSEVWYQLGMLSWNSARARRSGSFIERAEDIRALRTADTSLRIAAQLAPDSARYWTALGRYLLNSKVSITRFAAQGMLDKALEASRRSGQKDQIADAAAEVGMVYWRRYEAIADRGLSSIGEVPDPAQYVNLPPAQLVDYLNSVSRKLTPWSGQTEYEQAVTLFQEAYDANPSNVLAQRHFFMALADRARWDELRAAATSHLAKAPWDPTAWLALGLAEHRRNKGMAATVAFDSALSYLSDEDRARYTRLSRIMRPRPDGKLGVIADSATYAGLVASSRERLDALYWMISDPLALTPENEHRLEFLARVTYAELRWSADDLDLHGVDSDRGDILVRYGPPVTTIGFGSNTTGASSTVVWLYGDGLAFTFNIAPTFGTARLTPDFAARAEELRNTLPVRWTNVPVDAKMDTINVQIARFRSGRDSADLFVVAELPIDSLLRGRDVTMSPVDVDFHVFDPVAAVTSHDSTRMSIPYGKEARDAAVRLRAWRPRVVAGVNVVRIEALQPDALNAARALTKVTIVPDSSFGVSDVLVAERVAPKANARDAGQRWSDFAILPSAGTFRRGQTVDLLWETYALATVEGGNHYRVSITLEPQAGGGLRGLATKIVGGVGDVVGRSASGKGKVTLAYDRHVAARPILVDYLRFDVSAIPAGTYKLSVQIDDLVAKKRTTRQTKFQIVE